MLVVSNAIAEDNALLDDEVTEEIAGVFVVARTPDDVIGASAGVDDGDEDAELQLVKPG
jgi:hypothetical protein